MMTLLKKLRKPLKKVTKHEDIPVKKGNEISECPWLYITAAGIHTLLNKYLL